jgi:hypothetical protein
MYVKSPTMNASNRPTATTPNARMVSVRLLDIG